MPGVAVFVQFTLRPSGSPISGLMVVDALREVGWEVHLAYQQGGELLQRYRERCASVSQIDHGRWLAGGPWHRRARRLWADLRSARCFAKSFAELRPNLVYVNNLTGLSPILAAHRLGIPAIWHIRELFPDAGGEMYPPWPGGKRLVRYLVRHLPRGIIAISRAVVENVVGCTEHPRLTILPNAVSDDFFQETRSREEARALFGLPSDRPVVGVPGTLRPVKGHPFFLRAFAQVVRDVPTALAAITGDGESKYKGELQSLIGQLNIENNVRFLGTVQDMPAFYRACDVVCIPSRSEPFGRVAVEAMAVGTPVVATGVGGLMETIEHGVNGLLVPFGDVRALAGGLLGLLEDGNTRRRLAERGREQAKREYHSRPHGDRIRGLVACFQDTVPEAGWVEG